jgi:hypothetical protein
MAAFTQWGVRYPGSREVLVYDNEQDAREHLHDGGVLVSRDLIASPWIEEDD